MINENDLPPPKSCIDRFLARLEVTAASRYSQASLVYLLYVAIILFINLSLAPSADAAYTDDVYYNGDDYTSTNPEDTPYRQKLRGLNALYIAAGMIHLINALQYIYAWLPLGYGLLHPVMIPEYLNVLGAALYLWSASLYNQNITDFTYEGPSTLAVHRIETASSAIEVCAAFGWAGVWAWTYASGPGRGWTLDDPDFYGNFFIIAPSIMYLVYNLENLADPPSYGDNYLYRQADTLYFVGAVFYALAALRDDGWYQSFPMWTITRAAARVCGLGGPLEGCVERCYRPCDKEGGVGGSRGGGGASGVPLIDEDEEESLPIAPTGAGKGVYSSVKGAWS